MSASACKVTRPTLPNELMLSIVEYFQPGLRVDCARPLFTEWLPIRLTWSNWNKPEDAEVRIRTLRALSQTCKRLQVVVLPILWQIVHVDTVAALRRLRETLRISPHLAQHIRAFCFEWDDYLECQDVFQDEPSRLQAVLNEHEFWQSIGQKRSCTVSVNGQGKRILEYKESVGESGLAAEGDLGTSAVDFSDCIAEVVARLARLETFGWNTSIARLPPGVFNALSRLGTLTSLHLRLPPKVQDQSPLPLWLLAGNLKSLSFRLWIWNDVIKTEPTASALLSFELPAEPCDLSTFDLDLAVVLRTIVTAVQAGNLKRLNADYKSRRFEASQHYNIQSVFAIRSLLPFWVQIEKWGEQPTPAWPGAAESLRPLLAHASLWLHQADAHSDRHLTGQDVQELCVQYKQEHVPVRDVSENYMIDERPVTRYFAWLLEDAQLAQKVAEAWNAVVRDGGADLVTCLCDRCNTYYGKSGAFNEEVFAAKSDGEASEVFDDAGEALEEDAVETSDEEA